MELTKSSVSIEKKAAFVISDLIVGKQLSFTKSSLAKTLFGI
jgi:hypothetical protein